MLIALPTLSIVAAFLSGVYFINAALSRSKITEYEIPIFDAKGEHFESNTSTITFSYLRTSSIKKLHREELFVIIKPINNDNIDGRWEAWKENVHNNLQCKITIRDKDYKIKYEIDGEPCAIGGQWPGFVIRHDTLPPGRYYMVIKLYNNILEALTEVFTDEYCVLVQYSNSVLFMIPVMSIITSFTLLFISVVAIIIRSRC